METSAVAGGGWSTLDPAAASGGSISRRRRMVDVRSSGGAGGSISTRRMVDVGSCVVVVPEDRLLVAARPAGPLTHRSHVAGPGTRPPCSPSPSYRVPYVFGGDDDARPARRRPPVRGRILGSIIHPRVSTAARARRPAPLSHAPNVV